MAPVIRLTVPELLRARGWTAYQLSKASAGRISLAQAYRLERGTYRSIPRTVLDALVDVFGVDPGPLLTRAPVPRAIQARKAGRRPGPRRTPDP